MSTNVSEESLSSVPTSAEPSTSQAGSPHSSAKIDDYDHFRDENGTDIFQPYSKPNPFRGVEICPYPNPDIQHPIPYPYPNTQIVYL